MLPCRYCNGRTRVVNTELHPDGQHRWLRCSDCGGLTRSIETYADGRSCTGPLPGAKHKRKPRATGSRNGASVLTNENVLALREAAANGVRQIDLAQHYGIDPATVSRIVNRKAWGHIP